MHKKICLRCKKREIPPEKAWTDICDRFKRANKKGFFKQKDPGQIQKELDKFLKNNPDIKLHK